MTKKFTLQNSLFFCIILALLYASCKKEPEAPTSTESLSAIKLWYEQNKAPMTAPHNWMRSLTPNWKQIYTSENSEEMTFEIELNNPDKLFVGAITDPSKAEFARKNSVLRLLVVQTKATGTVQGYIIAIQNEEAKEIPLGKIHHANVGNYSVRLSYYYLDGSLAYGTKFTTGKFAGSFGPSTRQSATIRGKVAQANPDCHYENQVVWGWECISSGNEVDPYMYTNCNYKIKSSTEVEVCPNDSEGAPDPNNPPPGGGTGGTNTVPLDTIMQAKFYQHPKAMCTLNKLMQNNFFQNTLNNFIGETKPVDLTFKLEAIPQQTGYETLGQTILRPLSWNADNIDIIIDENLINVKASVVIAQTLLHEGIHAEINRKLISIHGPQNLNTTNFPSMFNMYSQYKISQGFSHEYMANYYIGLMGSALWEYDNKKFSLENYKAFAWIGLMETDYYTSLPDTTKQNVLSRISTLMTNRSTTNCNDQ